MDEKTRAALDRLIDVARSDTGQARWTAKFLLAWWNASSLGGFDFIEASNVDPALAEDMITIFAFMARSPGPVYPDADRTGIEVVIRQ